MKNFIFINHALGLQNLNNDATLYKNILESFFTQYNHLDLKQLNDTEFFIQIHTIKGLAQTIGAQKLFEIALEINTTKKRKKEKTLQKELEQVLIELSTLEQNKMKTSNNIQLEEKRKNQLLKNIKENAHAFKPKNIEEMLNELSKYKLEKNDLNLVNKLSKYLKAYDFIEIQKELEDI